MPKVIVEAPLTQEECATILISLELRQMRHPPASSNDAARLESLIKQFKGFLKLKS